MAADTAFTGTQKRQPETSPKEPFDQEAKTIFEPFRIKMVEPMPMLGPLARKTAIEKANFNLFTLPATSVTFDFLTDSGTSAMSASQWGAMMNGDESYAGSHSYFRFAEVISNLTSLPHVIPTHQGRSAEALLARALLKAGQVVPGNTHFDTTRANIETNGARALDLPCEESADSGKISPFKGNIHLGDLEKVLKESASKIPFVVITVTNNSVGGQPVSMQNLRETKALLNKYHVPLMIDAARFAENAYFIKTREPGFENKSITEIAHELFSYADIVAMSSKKDAFANIGGFLAVRDEGLAQEIRNLMVLTEGFPTYGGLAGRDLEALATGLTEILDEDYLRYRIRSTAYLGEGLSNCGFHLVKPFGGHAVYIDAGKTLDHLKPLEYPGHSLSVAFYTAMGLRSVEVGSVMLGSIDPVTKVEKPAPKELVRLAIPRRVYTQSHIDYILEKSEKLAKQVHSLPGYKITWQSPFLRHFTAKFAPQ